MDVQVIRVLRVALEVLSERALTFIAILMAFVLACWAMNDPEYPRLGVAAFFSIFVFIPCLMKEKRNERPRRQEESE
jgi:hypothetical protein